jgi:hypothetical protein
MEDLVKLIEIETDDKNILSKGNETSLPALPGAGRVWS